MSDSQTPRSNRRRIAGESAPAAKKAPARPIPPRRPVAPRPASRSEQPAVEQPTVEPAALAPKPASKVAAAVASRESAAQRPSTSTQRTQGSSSSSRPVSSAPWTIGAVAALVVGLVLTVLGVTHVRGESFADVRRSAVTSASAAAETVFSYRYDELEQHHAAATALMTPAFAKTYTDTVAPSLDELAPQRQVEVTATSRAAAAVPCGDECSRDDVSVLVYLDLDRRLADDDTATVFGNRVVVDLVRDGGDWKVSDIRAL